MGCGGRALERASLPHTGMDEELLFFPETLTIISDTGEPQGELTIEVQRGKYKDDMGIITHCLLVHAFSRSFIDKALCGSSLLGRVPAAPHIFYSIAPTPVHTALIRTCPLTYLGGGLRYGRRGEVIPRHMPGKRTVLTTLSLSHGHVAQARVSTFSRVHLRLLSPTTSALASLYSRLSNQ